MNKEQRTALYKYAEQLERITDELSSIYNKIEEVKNKEECKLDNMPDSFRYSDKGEEIESCIEQLDEALDLMDDGALTDVADILNSL